MISIGLHLRLAYDLADLVHRAERLQLPFFQSFFMFQHSREYILADSIAIEKFMIARKDNFSRLYGHSSYFINLACAYRQVEKLLLKELQIARRYQFTHLVVHPGCSVNGESKETSINTIARTLNKVLKRED